MNIGELGFDGLSFNSSHPYNVLESFFEQEQASLEQPGHYPEFSHQPSDEFVEGWRQHIESTGYPETYPGVSTSRPEQRHDITLLSEEIRVPTALRDGGERVPCPFCSPEKPKFFRGRMAHFPDENVVRFIGYACAKSHFGENYSAAEQVFDRQMRCRRYIRLWSDIGARRIEIESVLDTAELVAAAAEEFRGRMEEQAPGVCNFIQRELAQTKGELAILRDLGQKDRAGNAIFQNTIIGTAAGLQYLAPQNRPLQAIRNARAALAKTQIPMPPWEAVSPEHGATNEVLGLGRRTALSLRQLPDAISALYDAQAFLQPKNIALIQRWGQRPQSPFALFEMVRDARQLRIRIRSIAGSFFASPLVRSDHFSGPLPENNSLTLTWLRELVA